MLGADAGQSKVDRAESLGIPIVGEAQLRTLLERGELS